MLAMLVGEDAFIFKGSGVDTSDATATPNDVADGVTFYGPNGKETGALKNSIIDKTDNVVTIPYGIVKEEQIITIEESTGIIVDKNNILVGKGYIKEDVETTIGSGSVQINGDKVVIEEGYVFNNSLSVNEGSIQIDEEQNKIIVSGGYIDSQEIILPPKQESSNLTLGMIDENLNFQKLSFNGQEPSNDGESIEVEEYSSWKGTLEVETDNNNSCSSTSFYKCDSVDTTNKTWTGYKAVLADGVYSFEDTVTEGLIYGDALTPVKDVIYNDGVSIQVSKLYRGNIISEDGLVFHAPLQSNFVDVVGGATATATSGTFEVVNDRPCMKSQNGTCAEWRTGESFASGLDPMSMFVCFQRMDVMGYGMLVQIIGNGMFSLTYYDGELNAEGENIWAVYKEGTHLYIPPYEWHSYALTRENGVYHVYYDGELIYSNEISFNSVSPQYVVAGYDRHHGGKASGYFSDFLVYNRALSAEEVKAIHNTVMGV